MLGHDPAKLSFDAWRRSSARLAELEAALRAARDQQQDQLQAQALATELKALRLSTLDLYAQATAAARHSRGRRVRIW